MTPSKQHAVAHIVDIAAAVLCFIISFGIVVGVIGFNVSPDRLLGAALFTVIGIQSTLAAGRHKRLKAVHDNLEK